MFYFKSTDDFDKDPQVLAGVVLEERLPVVHCFAWGEVRQMICHCSARKNLWLRLEGFLARMQAGNAFSHVNLVGDFISNCDRPREIEAYLQTRSAHGPATFAAIQPMIDLGLDTIRRSYGLRLGFWVEGAPVGLNFADGPAGFEKIVQLPLDAYRY